ncbi:hypothetical protein GCM10009785_24120 [Brooklawnia cerclae]|uniref:Cardiolipin synthase N-terminal domain-containing protein n=1 Tax=Brooklawnia cerclae TaxID=349934 RepID=A0ABX0SB44_9ACTN|nr:PLDc N-terminal domain-containing protein [Brooklawnia cerclae]NIH55622.1 hypothetical protein [Brooklawnia cerclae]
MSFAEAWILLPQVIVLAALVTVLLRRGMALQERLLWVLVVIVLNIIGAIVWFGYLVNERRKQLSRPLGS